MSRVVSIGKLYLNASKLFFKGNMKRELEIEGDLMRLNTLIKILNEV